MSKESKPDRSSEMTRCIACRQDIPTGSSLCSHCKSHQRAWKNSLSYYSTIVGLATFVITALLYVASGTPQLWKLFTWQDKIQVLDLKIPGSIVLANIGDGDVVVRSFFWSGTVEGVNVNEALYINKKVSVKDVVETAELVRKDLLKVPVARYMTRDEVPKESLLKVFNEAFSVTNACYDFRISLRKERGVEESEAKAKRSVWSVPIEGTVYFYSLHSNKTFEEKVSAFGFVMKGEDVKCLK